MIRSRSAWLRGRNHGASKFVQLSSMSYVDGLDRIIITVGFILLSLVVVIVVLMISDGVRKCVKAFRFSHNASVLLLYRFRGNRRLRQIIASNVSVFR
jgi:glycopeptide antibiotics resistance protein